MGKYEANTFFEIHFTHHVGDEVEGIFGLEGISEHFLLAFFFVNVFKFFNNLIILSCFCGEMRKY